VKQHRIAMRASVMTALNGVLRFKSFTAIKGWSQSVDADTLPVYGVATMRENSSAAGYDTHERRVELKVRFTRMGDDTVEDVLDTDAEVVEGLLLPLLRAAYLHAEISQTELQLAGEGKQRVGKIELTFLVLLQTDMPA
jgi:hypothetical protein